MTEYCYKSNALDFPHKFCYSNIEMANPLPDGITKIKQLQNSDTDKSDFLEVKHNGEVEVQTSIAAFTDNSYYKLPPGFDKKTCVMLRGTQTEPTMYACAKHDDDRAIAVAEFRSHNNNTYPPRP